MNDRKPGAWLSVIAATVALAVPLYLFAQGPVPQAGPAGQDKGPGGGKGNGKGGGGRAGGAPVNPRQAAPIDLTGYWVSQVTEDWMYRMVTPAKGDVASVPVSAAGRGAAASWDPATDEAAGEQCKAYGAAAIVRVPGRMHIEWQDDNTLRIDFDAGTQTRLLHFNGTPSGDAGYQGYSVASWDVPGRGGRGGPAQGIFSGGPGGAAAIRAGALKVITTRLKPGYLRKNGVPYDASTMLTEYFDKVTLPGGQALLIVKSIVEDAAMLTEPFITSTHFKKEPDGSRWNPSACSAR